MIARIILIEDDCELLTFYQDSLVDHGFGDIVTFGDTENIVNNIVDAYTKPSIIWTDYFIGPTSPRVFLPEIRERKINMPVVMVSGKAKVNQLNQFSLKYPLAGCFEKGTDTRRLVSDVAQHLMDLNQSAIKAWTVFDIGRQAQAFVSGYKEDARMVIQRLLCNEEAKEISADAGMHVDTVRKYKRELASFIGTEPGVVPLRYTALYEATYSS